MRFISKFQSYKFIAVHEEVELLASGQAKRIAPGFICEFTHGGTNDYERDIALQTFKFNGVPRDESGTRHIDPVFRVSSYDTAVIENPDLRKKVEKALLAGQGAENHILTEKPTVAAPWPSYDRLVAQGKRTVDMVADKIASTVTDQGYDVSEVLAYEVANLNRPVVLAALEALKVAEPEEALVIA
jgi:hypothetical protein